MGYDAIFPLRAREELKDKQQRKEKEKLEN